MPVPEGPDGVLLVDKPAGLTSTRALALCKRALGSRKGGHTGTLDPFATGLLPLVFGEATKFSRFLLDSDKTYTATLRLGATSTTGDTEGEIRPGGPVPSGLAQIEAVSRELQGNSLQVPPMHSAVRVQGQRLYDLARQGLEVERAPRAIQVEFIEIVEFSGERLVISLKCSKGTYVRTLAESLGEQPPHRAGGGLQQRVNIGHGECLAKGPQIYTDGRGWLCQVACHAICVHLCPTVAKALHAGAAGS